MPDSVTHASDDEPSESIAIDGIDGGEWELPTDLDLINLLLAREGDTVSLTESNDKTVEIDAIIHERNTREKRVKLSDGTIVARREGDGAVRRAARKDGPNEADIEQFRVTNRMLMLRPEAWDAREEDVPVTRYRHVRVDEAARLPIAKLVGWLAATWDIDERTGNGSWRKSRDDVLAAAYRLSQGEPDPQAEGTFTVETIEREIVQSALDRAPTDEDAPFSEQRLKAIEAQIETPGHEAWSEDTPDTGE